MFQGFRVCGRGFTDDVIVVGGASLNMNFCLEEADLPKSTIEQFLGVFLIIIIIIY